MTTFRATSTSKTSTKQRLQIIHSNPQYGFFRSGLAIRLPKYLLQSQQSATASTKILPPRIRKSNAIPLDLSNI